MSMFRRRKRAVGSIIGASFLLLILITSFTYHQMFIKQASLVMDVQSEMRSFDNDREGESLIITSVTRTVSGYLSLSIENSGVTSSKIIWIGVFDESYDPVKQNWYSIDESIEPLETVTDVGDGVVPLEDGVKVTIQITTALGNIYYTIYPEQSSSEPGDERYIYTYESSDNHSPSQIGSHSFFSAMQSAPDGIFNTVTESSAGSTTVTLINAESFEGSWLPSSWSESPSWSRWNKEADQSYDGSYSADFDGLGGGRSGALESPVLDCSDANKITIDFWFYDGGTNDGEFLVEIYDGASWDLLIDLETISVNTVWVQYQTEIIDPQYHISNFQVRWRAYDLENGKQAYFDLVTIEKETPGDNYECDLELTWSDLDYSRNNEWLNIYCGAMATEDILVDVWNGSQWVNIISQLTPGWNTADISTYLDSSTFTIRLRDETPTGDSTQDNWDIDSIFLNLWD